jgi:hypothetical protein
MLSPPADERKGRELNGDDLIAAEAFIWCRCLEAVAFDKHSHRIYPIRPATTDGVIEEYRLHISLR